MSYYTTTRGSLISRLSRTLRSEESRYAPRHHTLGGVCKQWWGLEVASRAYNKRVQSWQQAEDENYIWSSEKNIDHMQELQSCMAEHDRIELAFQKTNKIRGSVKAGGVFGSHDRARDIGKG